MIAELLAHSIIYAIISIPIIVFVHLAHRPDNQLSIVAKPRLAFIYMVKGISGGTSLSFLTIVWAAIYGWKKGIGSVARWFTIATVLFSLYFVIVGYLEVTKSRLDFFEGEENIFFQKKKKNTQLNLMPALFYAQAFYLNGLFTKQLGSAVTIPAFFVFPPACYFISKRWEVEMAIPQLAFRVSGAYLILLVVAMAYFVIVPIMWFREGATVVDRALIRVLMHPILMESACLAVRVFARGTDFGPQANQALIPIFLSPLLGLSSLYGRFLIAASNSFLITLAFSVMVGVIECSMRLTCGKRDWVWFRFTKGKEYADVMARDPERLAFRARLVALEAMIEWFAIVAGSVAQHLFSAERPGVGHLLASIAAQVGIETVVITVIGALEETYAKVPISKEWQERGSRKAYFWSHLSEVLIFTVFTIVTISDPLSDSFVKYSLKEAAEGTNGQA
jgi:hypothetical protein